MARAIKKLHILGSGFRIIPVGNKRLVQSVPGELSMDHAAVLQQAQVLVVVVVVVAVVIVPKKAIRLRSKTTTLYVLHPF